MISPFVEIVKITKKLVRILNPIECDGPAFLLGINTREVGASNLIIRVIFDLGEDRNINSNICPNINISPKVSVSLKVHRKRWSLIPLGNK